jgi:predicted secreted protein
MARAMGDSVDFIYGGVTDAENQTNSVTLNFTVPEGDITAFGDAWQNVLAGKPKAALDVSLLWDPASNEMDAEVFADLGTAAVVWNFEPDGTTGYDGFAIVTSYSITAAVGAPITASLALSHNGGSAAADGAAPTRA